MDVQVEVLPDPGNVDPSVDWRIEVRIRFDDDDPRTWGFIQSYACTWRNGTFHLTQKPENGPAWIGEPVADPGHEPTTRLHEDSPFVWYNTDGDRFEALKAMYQEPEHVYDVTNGPENIRPAFQDWHCILIDHPGTFIRRIDEDNLLIRDTTLDIVPTLQTEPTSRYYFQAMHRILVTDITHQAPEILVHLHTFERNGHLMYEILACDMTGFQQASHEQESSIWNATF
ncbi:MAG TPA: hypothetical protein VHI13_13920 [Candidatus Kapabacteria bacterium]|nr:hypothetical protein [Candidatus Kapabacteria bacterium]